MPIEILMPALSPTMTEGNLAKWLKKEGDKVKPGDVIAEIETDKATMEVEAVDKGTLGRILVKEGTQGVAVNQLIAVLLEEGEEKSALEAFIGNIKQAPASEAPKSTSPQQQDITKLTQMIPPVLEPEVIASNAKRIIASPLAKRLAEQQGINLTGVKGSGPRGRIVRADLQGEAPASSTSQPRRAASREDQHIPVTGMRKVIAKRLVESKQTVPHFYLTIDVRCDKLLAIRKEMNDAAPKDPSGKEVYKLSVNDFIIKAVALSLRDVPEANASWAEDVVIRYGSVDVAVAVAIDGGLITPIIRQADQKSLSELSNEMKSLAARARENKLRPEEFQGGGFSISNLGMYGIKQFQAIINPPQSCILAVGQSEERPVVEDGKLAVGTVMDLSLSVDHRVVDGAIGANFLKALKAYLEQPVTMLV